jgi:hypothetical protein
VRSCAQWGLSAINLATILDDALERRDVSRFPS